MFSLSLANHSGRKKKIGARIVKERLLFRKKKNNHLLPCLLLALSDSNPTKGGENQRPQTSPIEAQLKHANALILFSLVVLLGLWRIIRFFFFMPAWDHSVWTAMTCVSVCWRLNKHLSLSNHLGKGGRQRRGFILAEIPSCIRAHLLWCALAALRVIVNLTENGI